MNITFRTRAAFILPNTKAWKWVTWSNTHPSKHAAIIEKAKELNAVSWDFGNADHEESSRANF